MTNDMLRRRTVNTNDDGPLLEDSGTTARVAQKKQAKTYACLVIGLVIMATLAIIIFVTLFGVASNMCHGDVFEEYVVSEFDDNFGRLEIFLRQV
jgi:hypothetical protein